MGFLDKIKGAVNAVTGGAAKVTMEFKPANAFPGDTVGVKITAVSTGQPVKSKGVFVDLQGLEGIKIKANDTPGAANADTNISKSTFSQEFKIAPDFVLNAGETKLFEGTFVIPANVQPSYQGNYVRHEWQLRGRLEAFGNDPDTGWLAFRIGNKS